MDDEKLHDFIIAAAPEMYRELHDCRRFLRFLLSTKQKWIEDRVNKRLKLVEKVIAKASGEECRDGTDCIEAAAKATIATDNTGHCT